MTADPHAPLSGRSRRAVLAVAFAALLFDGMELGLMPVAARSVAASFLGEAFTVELGGVWFARLNASLLLGAAVGGLWLGYLGDQLGRARALALSVLCYSVFCGLGYFATGLGQMLVLRFLVGLGVGGVWPNAVALVAECWPSASRPFVAGVMGAGINAGIFLLSRLTAVVPITPESWRWVFAICAAPALLGVYAWQRLPESPAWLAARRSGHGRPAVRTAPRAHAADLFRPPLLRATLVGIALGSIPLVGAWAASKWVFPWAELVAGPGRPDYKSTAQAWWSVGAVLGSFSGAHLAGAIGRRRSYFLISFGSAALTGGLFLFAEPTRPGFLPLLFAQGFVATLFFGWLPLYLPELFPTRVRATGSGIAYNVGRFATAAGLFAAGSLVGVFGGDYAKTGAAMSAIYALGMVAVWFAPETRGRGLQD